MRRRFLIPIILLILLGVTAAINAERIVLTIAGYLAKSRTDVGPNHSISWESAPTPAPGTGTGKPQPPNIVLILADDMGWNDVSFYGGDSTVTTPNLDTIAAQGVTLTRGYAGNATCAPSRAALMTGRYPTRFGFEFTPTPPGMMQLAQLASLAGIDNGKMRPRLIYPEAESVDYDDMGMPGSELTVAELLQSRGYHTAHIGKWHLGRGPGMMPQDQGFDESLLMASGLYLPEDHPDVVNAKQDFDQIDQFLWAAMQYAVAFNGQPAMEPRGYLTDYFTDSAVQVIAANRHRPFFLYLAHWAPHTPLQATKADYAAVAHLETHRERVYAAMILALDRSVGRVMAALKANGLDDNTLVIFSSDNGGADYIGLPNINAPLRGWKQTLFEGGIRVPFLARWPGRIPAGSLFDQPVHHFDVFATAAEAAGAALPADRTIDGVSLLPFLTGQRSDAPHKALFWRSGASQTAVVDGWKLNISDPPGKAWLFDMRNDPTERNNLAELHPDKVKELIAALNAHNAEQAPPAWQALIANPVNIDKDLSQPDAEDDEYVYWSN
jgi:arylsulfatase A-like enzyme